MINYAAKKKQRLNIGSKLPTITRLSPLAKVPHAYHFDASLYAKMLRTLSEGMGVRRVEGKVIDVSVHGENGFIQAGSLHRKHSGLFRSVYFASF